MVDSQPHNPNSGGVAMGICPKCGCGDCKKDGIVKGRQRYKCKTCGYRHTVQHVGKSSTVKRQALELYLEGLGFRSIGRILKCSHVAVYNWIKAFGEAAADIRSEKAIEIVGVDEMHSYISSKKDTVGSGLLLIDMGRDSSAAYWAIGGQPPESDCGMPSRTSRSEK
jgi:transposase-like protein